MLLFYYINLVKYKKNFDSSKFLECLIFWNGGSTVYLKARVYPTYTYACRNPSRRSDPVLLVG